MAAPRKVHVFDYNGLVQLVVAIVPGGVAAREVARRLASRGGAVGNEILVPTGGSLVNHDTVNPLRGIAHHPEWETRVIGIINLVNLNPSSIRTRLLPLRAMRG